MKREAAAAVMAGASIVGAAVLGVALLRDHGTLGIVFLAIIGAGVVMAAVATVFAHRFRQRSCAIGGHWGWLQEIAAVDDERAEYVCRNCGWRGVRARPPTRLKPYGF